MIWQKVSSLINRTQLSHTTWNQCRLVLICQYIKPLLQSFCCSFVLVISVCYHCDNLGAFLNAVKLSKAAPLVVLFLFYFTLQQALKAVRNYHLITLPPAPWHKQAEGERKKKEAKNSINNWVKLSINWIFLGIKRKKSKQTGRQQRNNDNIFTLGSHCSKITNVNKWDLSQSWSLWLRETALVNSETGKEGPTSSYSSLVHLVNGD